jgi:class 3 adenylate cyclase
VHHGRIVKRTGDGSIIEFRSVVDAVRCAIEVQNGMVERNAGLPPDRRIEFRVGIHSDTTAAYSAANECCLMRGVCQGVGFCGRPVNRVITR